MSKYMKIYENFIKDRNKLLYEIELVDKKMENELLDLLCDVIDIKGIYYKFYSSLNNGNSNKNYTYYLHIENERLERDFDPNTSFREIKSIFKNNVYQMNDILSLDYDIKYTLGVIRILRDDLGLRSGTLPNARRDIDFNYLKNEIEKMTDDHFLHYFSIRINEK